MDVIFASVTPSVANNSLPPPPRASRRKGDFSNGSSTVQSGKTESSAHGNPRPSFGAQHPRSPIASRRPSAPTTYRNGSLTAGSSRDGGISDRKLQLNNVSPMLSRGHSAQGRMETPTQPAPSETYLDTRYISPTKPTNSNVPLSSSRSSLEHSNEWDPNPFYLPSTYKHRNNSSASSFFTGRNSPDPKPPPIPAPQFPSPEAQSHPAKANKILGIGLPNTAPSQARYIEHQPPRRSYDKEERGVQWSRNSKANKLLGLTLDEGTTFTPPPRSDSSRPPGRTATPPRRGAPAMVSSGHTRVGGASSTEETGDSLRWRRGGLMDFSPSGTAHQKSRSQPEILSRLPDSARSFQTTFSVISTDSGIPEFTKRRPESIGKSQPNTTLKVFKELMKKVDGKTKDGHVGDEWDVVGAKEADSDPWGWGVSLSAHERRTSEWADAHTLPDEEQEERTTPIQTSLDLSRAQSTSVNVLDQEERLAVIRRKKKIMQLLGTGIPPYTLGPATQDRPSMESRESWEPLNKQGTTYLDAQGNVRDGRRSGDSRRSGDTEQSSHATSILTANDGVNEFGRNNKDVRALDSPTSFMELSDEEVDSPKGKAKGIEYIPLPQQFREIPTVGPPTPPKGPVESSTSSSGRTFSTFNTSDPSFSPPGGKTLKHKPSFITEILEESDWEAHERKKKREKLAKMHRFLGSRVPAELVLGYSSVTTPPGPPIFEEDLQGPENPRGKGNMHTTSVGWKSEHEMRNIGTMAGSEKMIQIRRVQKIEKMFGEQPPSALLRPSASVLASAPPPFRPAPLPSSHSASRLGAAYPTTPYGPTPFTRNVTYNINSLYEHAREKKLKDNSSTASTTGLINHSKEQDRGWKGTRTARLTTPPEDTVLDISCVDKVSALLPKESPHSSRMRPPLSKGRHSAQFVHYRNSFKSLAMIYNQGDKASLQELYAMLNSTSPAGSDTEAELAHTRHIQDVSGYDSDSASLIGTPSRRRSRPSRMSVMSMSSVSSASSLSTLTPEPMGFQARRKRAAKLTNFFGASYRDLFGEVLERLEIGFLEEAREGNMSPQEIDDLMGQVKTLKGRKAGNW